ncbi:MAG: hypothetical protein ABRQ37_27225 [Candidatus Eremiobacterota bacterium]
MKEIKYLPEEELIKKATEILIRELGPVEAIRYMTLPQQKIVDSIKRHKKWQKSLNKEEFLNKIFGP